MEPVAECEEFVHVEFLLLVRDVASFAGLAQPVALDGASQDDRRCTLVTYRCVIGRVDLCGIVTAQPHAPKFVVASTRNHREQARVHAVEVLADVGAAGD